MSFKKRPKSSIESIGQNESSDDDYPKEIDTNATNIHTCERILKMRYNSKLARTEYLLKWLNFPESKSTWEPKENIIDKTLLEEYKIRIKNSAENIKPSSSYNIFQLQQSTSKQTNNEEKSIKYTTTATTTTTIVKSKPPIHLTKRLSNESKPRTSILSKCDLNEKFKKVKTNNNKQVIKRTSLPLTDDDYDDEIIEQEVEQQQQQSKDIKKSNSFKVRDLHKYTNGQEPKILKEFTDPITGSLMFEIKWRHLAQQESMSADLVRTKYPDVYEHFVSLNTPNNNHRIIITEPTLKETNLNQDISMEDEQQQQQQQHHVALMEIDEEKQHHSNNNNNRDKLSDINDLYELEKIVTLIQKNNERYFIIKWRNQTEEVSVLSSVINCKYPQEVIKFYEQHTSFEAR